MNANIDPECAACPLLDGPANPGCQDDPDEQGIPGTTQVALTAGDQLFEEGTPIEGIHCIHSGKAAIVKKMDDEHCIVAVASAGDVLGMPDILGSDLHRNGALAMEDISACFIPKQEALAMIRSNPQIMLRVMRRMCERIQTMEQHIEQRAPVGGP